VVRANLHRFDGGLHGGVRRQQNDENVLVALLDPAQHRDPVDVRQLVVEQDQIDAFVQAIQRLTAGFGFEHFIAFSFEALGQRPANQAFIVNDEDGRFGHRL
jgi:hypothetical protein